MSLEDIRMSIQDLREEKQLDAGGCGTISLCVHKKHGYVVLKKVYTGPQRNEYNTSLLEEGKIMHKLHHDRVVKLLGVILEDGNHSLVMEYVDRGNMMKVLQEHPLPLTVKGRFVLEIIEGMLYLHKQGFVHKDLKPENILVDRDFHIKIADLGVACFKSWSKLTQEESSRQKQITSKRQNNAGTLFYMAPEHLVNLNAKPVEKSDVYSFGIVIWAIFANKEPYENTINNNQIYYAITIGNRPNLEEITGKCPMEIIDLMKQCWAQESEKRPTFTEIYEKYMPFYCETLGKNIEEDLKNLKKMLDEQDKMLNRMESLQVDAAPEDTSNDQPKSLHSSQGPVISDVNEALFAPCPMSEPVESCETSCTPAYDLERKLQCEYNYHVYGSRMDKAVRPVGYTPEMTEEERKRRVSSDPFAKPPPASQKSELHPRAEKTGSNTNQYVLSSHDLNFQLQAGSNTNPRVWSDHNPKLRLQAGSNTNPYILPKPDPNFGSRAAATAPNQGTLDIFYGPNRNSLLTGNPEDLYELGLAGALQLNNPPVLDSGQNLQSQTNANWYSNNSDTYAGNKDSPAFTRGTFAYRPSLPASGSDLYTDDSSKYTISNSYGVQIGCNNHMSMVEYSQPVHTSPAVTEANYRTYEATGIFDDPTVLTDKHLNLVRENLARQWKHCARKLGFCDPEIDEIDHDYERDGLKEKVYQMLLKWEMKEGSKGATVGKLAKALFGCKRLDLLTSLMKIRE
ncbi:receptor-interacting serine/threonine-protein kinase 1 [Pithys albifrons albifrons]|uniref:receptor-interacting serine/threonine-protein kinase 1 n=1 Tax=Pithys albifrons albifrons TaxID=3385563 RepID=UPI003A5D224D